MPLHMESADSLVFNAVVAAGFNFTTAADIIADQGYRFSPDEIRVYFTRISDAIEGVSKRSEDVGLLSQVTSSFPQGDLDDLDLDDLLSDEQSATLPSSAPSFVPAVVEQSIESLRADEEARIKKCEARQEERNAMFDRVLASLGGSEGSYDLPIPARHARYGTAVLSTQHATFVETNIPEVIKDTTTPPPTCEVLSDPCDVEAHFFATVSSTEHIHVPLSAAVAAVNTGSWGATSGVFSRLETEPTEVEAITNELWVKLLGEAVSNVPSSSYHAHDSDLADVLKVLSSEPVGVRIAKAHIAPLMSRADDIPPPSRGSSPRATQPFTKDAPTVAHSSAQQSAEPSAVRAEESGSSDDDMVAQRRKAKQASVFPAVALATPQLLPEHAPFVQSDINLHQPIMATEDASTCITPAMDALDYVHAAPIMRRVIPLAQGEQADALSYGQISSYPSQSTDGSSPSESWKYSSTKPSIASFVDPAKHTMLAALLRHT